VLDRRNYAACRAQALPEKLKASRWAELWGAIAGIRPSRRG